MSRFSGPQRHEAGYAAGKNKGVRAYARMLRREAAVERNEHTPLERRSRKRSVTG